MNTTATPISPKIEFGKLLNLVVKGSEDESITKQFLVAKSFDYRVFFERIRKSGIFRSDEVLVELSRILIQEGYVLEPSSVEIQIGEAGRPSDAMMDVYKHKLNDSSGTVDRVMQLIEKECFTLEGPEGDLYVMKTDIGQALGHVKVIIGHPRNIERQTVLDILGPNNSLFPDDIQEQLESKISELLAEEFGEEYLALKTIFRRSDLALSEEILLKESA